jgi:hypothetical protein
MVYLIISIVIILILYLLYSHYLSNYIKNKIENRRFVREYNLLLNDLKLKISKVSFSEIQSDLDSYSARIEIVRNNINSIKKYDLNTEMNDLEKFFNYNPKEHLFNKNGTNERTEKNH